MKRVSAFPQHLILGHVGAKGEVSFCMQAFLSAPYGVAKSQESKV
jgi:hypothetical protein